MLLVVLSCSDFVVAVMNNGTQSNVSRIRLTLRAEGTTGRPFVVVSNSSKHSFVFRSSRASSLILKASRLLLPSRPNWCEELAATIKAPASAFPRQEGIRLHLITCPMVNGAWTSKAAGMIKRFVTECSNPMAIKVEAGNHVATSFPTISLDAPARIMARLTNQLHMIALTSV